MAAEQTGNICNVSDLPLVLKINPHVMDILGICKEHAYTLANRQDFPAIRIGRSIRVPRDAFLRWIEAQTSEGERNGH